MPDAIIASRTSFDGHSVVETRCVLPSRSSKLTVTITSASPGFAPEAVGSKICV